MSEVWEHQRRAKEKWKTEGRKSIGKTAKEEKPSRCGRFARGPCSSGTIIREDIISDL